MSELEAAKDVRDQMDLPEGWCWSTLGEIADVDLGKTPRKTDYASEGTCKIIKFRDVTASGEINWHKDDRGFVKQEDNILASLKDVREDDILITASAHSSEQIGKKVAQVRFLPDRFERVFVVGEILRVRVSNRDLARLLTQFFTSGVGYRAVQSKVHGVHLIASRAREIPVPIPSEPRIAPTVSKIDELFSQVDEGEACLKRVEKLLERYRQSVLKAAVTGELTRDWRKKHSTEGETGDELLQRILIERRTTWEEAELAKMKAKGKPPQNDKWKERYKEPTPPETTGLSDLPDGWVWATLEQLADGAPNSITDGPFGSNLKTAHYTNAGPRVVRLQNLGDGQFIDHETHISKKHFDTLQKHRVFPGDLIIAILGSPLPRACAVPDELGPAIVKADCVRFKPAEGLVRQQYVYIAINSEIVRAPCKKVIHGVGRPRLNLKNVRSIAVPLPPKIEQSLICEMADVRLSQIDHLRKEAATFQLRFYALRQSILKSAFSGKLVPQDPNDEPASILLERIRTEREAAVEAGKASKSKRRKKTPARAN